MWFTTLYLFTPLCFMKEHTPNHPKADLNDILLLTDIHVHTKRMYSEKISELYM